MTPKFGNQLRVPTNSNEELQQQLKLFYDWAHYNNMKFNDDKFQALYHGKMEQNQSYTSPDGKTILQKQSVKDLGVYMSADGKFKTHIQNIVMTANKLTAWAMRIFIIRDTSLMITLYKSLILSKLEYACILWSPADAYCINLLESVQRRFTSRLPIFLTYNEELEMPICTTNYWERLKQLKIFSLERRRERYMIIHIYKILIGLCPNPGLVRDFNLRTKITVVPKINPKAPAWVKNLRHSTFFCRGPQLYNKLPTELRELEDINIPEKKHVEIFKAKLDNILRRIPDQPTASELVRAAESNSILHQVAYISPDM